jgi:hypothetical protein
MSIKRNPYPILEKEHGDFDEKYSFDTELINASVENGIFKFHFNAKLNEPNLEKLQSEKKIKFGVLVESKPYFSKLFFSSDSFENKVEISINYQDVPATFSFIFKPMLIAVENFIYKNSNAFTPLDQYEFKINENQILARSKTEVSFEVGYKDLNSGALIKILQLKSGESTYSGTYDIKLDESNNILVYFNEDDYKKLIKLNGEHPKLLDELITVPVLQYALSDFLKNPTDYEDTTREWFVELDKIFDISDTVKDMRDVLKKCNEILNSPLIPFIEFFQNKYKDE